MTTKIECIKTCRKSGGTLISCLLKCFGGGNTTPPPVPVSLSSIVQQATSCTAIHVPDKHMDLSTDADMQRCLAQDQTDKKQYVAEWFDCDDFARNTWNNIRNMALAEGKNIAFAMVWTDSHALNLYVNNKQQVIFIEPQTDKQTTIHSTPKFIIF